MLDNTLPLFSLQEKTKEIPLTQGEFAIVDAADFDWLMRWKWYALNGDKYTFYAARTARQQDGRKGVVLMHREILRVGTEMLVDHKDGNGLNNTRHNLRPCTHGENQRNRDKSRRNTSGFKGVYFDRRSGKWQAQIRINGKNKSFGLHDNAVDAARAYDVAAHELYGDFARFNFEDESLR